MFVEKWVDLFMTDNVRNLVSAGIVLYKPDFKRLNKNLYQLMQVLDTVILYNNDADLSQIKIPFQFKDRIIIIGNGSNRGIAYALNCIMNKADELGSKWVITLDQDSIIPRNMIDEYSKYLNYAKIAIVCPQPIDNRRKYEKIVTTPETEYVDVCITSGSCTNVDIWKKVGKFDEWLFIDLVDNDFCKRIILSGYKILKINSVILDHQYGMLKRRSKITETFFLKMGDLLNNVNIQKLSFKRLVNPIRIYYENRNVIYLNKKYEKFGGIGYENHHCRTYMGFFITFSVYSFLVGKNKKRIWKAIINGVNDGKSKKVIPWDVNN